jgi:hypothetical protein
MSTKSPECWANDLQAHGVRVEISEIIPYSSPMTNSPSLRHESLGLTDIPGHAAPEKAFWRYSRTFSVIIASRELVKVPTKVNVALLKSAFKRGEINIEQSPMEL